MSVKTVKLRNETCSGKSKKKAGDHFPSSSSQILSHTTSLTLVKSNPIYECFLETSTLDPKISMDLLDATGLMKSQNTDMSRREYSFSLFTLTRWHYYDMICLYPWLCPSSRSSVASVYMNFHKPFATLLLSSELLSTCHILRVTCQREWFAELNVASVTFGNM